MRSLEVLGVKSGKYYEEAIYSLVLIYNIFDDEISRFLKPFNLTPGKFNILLVTKHQGKDQGISQVDISKRLIVTPSNMTKMLVKLGKDGFIERLALEGDRRVNLIRITKKGSHVLDQVWSGYNAKLESFVARLSTDTQKRLAELLGIWLSKLAEE